MFLPSLFFWYLMLRLFQKICWQTSMLNCSITLFAATLRVLLDFLDVGFSSCQFDFLTSEFGSTGHPLTEPLQFEVQIWNHLLLFNIKIEKNLRKFSLRSTKFHFERCIFNGFLLWSEKLWLATIVSARLLKTRLINWPAFSIPPLTLVSNRHCSIISFGLSNKLGFNLI